MRVAGLMVAAAAALAVGTNALELAEVRQSLQQLKRDVKGELRSARIELKTKFKEIRKDIRSQIRSLNASIPVEEQWDMISAMYDTLAAYDPPVYQGILDKYFSSTGDLYEVLEENISPWYDKFDELQIYNYRYYALVDKYDKLYSVVDNVNHQLYDKADIWFENLYDLLEDTTPVVGAGKEAPAPNATVADWGKTCRSNHEDSSSDYLSKSIESSLLSRETQTVARESFQENLRKSESGLSTTATVAIVAATVCSVGALGAALVVLRRQSAMNAREHQSVVASPVA